MSGPPGPGGACPPVGDSDTAAEVQDLVNRLGVLSGAAGVYRDLVRHRATVPAAAPWGLGSDSYEMLRTQSSWGLRSLVAHIRASGRN